MKKTSLSLDADLVKELKQVAASENKSMSLAVHEAIAQYVADRKPRNFKLREVNCDLVPTEEFKSMSWDKIRDIIYEGRGT